MRGQFLHSTERKMIMSTWGNITSVRLSVTKGGQHRAALRRDNGYTTSVAISEMVFKGLSNGSWTIFVDDASGDNGANLCMSKAIYDKVFAHQEPETSWDALDESPPTIPDPLAQIKSDVNSQAHTIIGVLDRLSEVAPTTYGSFRLEVVAATDTKPMYADLFGLDVIDADPANEATDTIVCSINMLGADMCQHKQFPDQPDDNQWVIEVLAANGVKHRFHTHSAGDFGRIFDAIRAGTTTKVYSTRPTPAPSDGSTT